MEKIDCLVIGAGVIGLAVARALALQGREVVVVESEASIGTGTSSRNSEVIHAGIYYPPGSLKAQLCVAGRNALYAFCALHGVPHQRIGKLIVAINPAQLADLEKIGGTARANGVDDLRLVGQPELERLEPSLAAEGALLSPSTGIIDSHAFMLALQGDAENAGAVFAFRTPFLRGELSASGMIAHLGDEDTALHARLVVNAAGLSAHQVAASIAGLDRTTVPHVGFAKGNYFGCSVPAPFRHLIYPVPEPGGLGIHLTLDMGGHARFGPDVEWIDTIRYEVDASRAEPFYSAIRRYWRALPDGALYPDYAGIRVKLERQPSPDFRIDLHALPALVNLYGLESPGLTSALAIADFVASAVAVGAEA